MPTFARTQRIARVALGLAGTKNNNPNMKNINPNGMGVNMPISPMIHRAEPKSVQKIRVIFLSVRCHLFYIDCIYI